MGDPFFLWWVEMFGSPPSAHQRPMFDDAREAFARGQKDDYEWFFFRTVETTQDFRRLPDDASPEAKRDALDRLRDTTTTITTAFGAGRTR